MDFKKPEYIGEVPLVNRIDNHPESGKVVGTAKIERLASGAHIAHIDARGMTGEMLRRGFSAPPLSVSLAKKKESK